MDPGLTLGLGFKNKGETSAGLYWEIRLTRNWWAHPPTCWKHLKWLALWRFLGQLAENSRFNWHNIQY